MQTDFLDAHLRHQTDAEHLFGLQRLANADHLYGMAAECGLKRLMLAFGMRFDSENDRPENSIDRKHADGVWARFEAYRSGHAAGPDYEPGDNPFADWKVEQRYAAQCHFTQAVVSQHRAGAARVCSLIKKAELAGLLT